MSGLPMQTETHPPARERQRRAAVLIVLLAMGWAADASATTSVFGAGANQFSLTFNTINTIYEMGDTEVLNEQFNKFYLATKGIAYANNAGRPLTDGACRVSGIEVVDFINWLNTSSGFPAAYTFNGTHTALVNWNRAAGARYVLPSLNEWNSGYTSNHYAPGPCAFEWIQDTGGVGTGLDGVKDGLSGKNFDDAFSIKYTDTGFRVIRLIPPPGSLDHFEVAVISPQRAGVPFMVTVTAKAANGATVTGDNTTVVTMTANTGNVQFDSDGNETFGDNAKTLANGTFTIKVRDTVAESVIITATGGGSTNNSPVITVNVPPPPEIVTFGSGAGQFSMTFTSITAALNAGDTEVLNDQFNKFYLATKGFAYPANVGLAPTDAACQLSGIETIGFINWLNTSSGWPAAYTFNQDRTALVSWTRTPGAKFFLPTEAEWNAALPYINYAPGPCISEWIQDTGGGDGGNMNGVDEWVANKIWDDGFDNPYPDVGFRVISDPLVQSQFDSWIIGSPQTGFTDDPNHDGVTNGLAWLLNGTAMGDSRSRLPLRSTAGGKLILNFQCLKAGARGTAILDVQYSNDLGKTDPWHSAAVPDSTPPGPINGVVFTVTPITASNYQNITAEIPQTAASAGRLFGRLQGSQN